MPSHNDTFILKKFNSFIRTMLVHYQIFFIGLMMYGAFSENFEYESIQNFVEHNILNPFFNNKKNSFRIRSTWRRLGRSRRSL